jgi:hypothetical protein
MSDICDIFAKLTDSIRIQGLPPLYSLWCLQSSLEYMVSTGESLLCILKLAVLYGIRLASIWSPPVEQSSSQFHRANVQHSDGHPEPPFP